MLSYYLVYVLYPLYKVFYLYAKCTALREILTDALHLEIWQGKY